MNDFQKTAAYVREHIKLTKQATDYAEDAFDTILGAPRTAMGQFRTAANSDFAKEDQLLRIAGGAAGASIGAGAGGHLAKGLGASPNIAMLVALLSGAAGAGLGGRAMGVA